MLTTTSIKHSFRLVIGLFLTFLLIACGGSNDSSKPKFKLNNFPINNISTLDESEKLSQIDTTNRLIDVQATPFVNLYAASTEGQPEHPPGSLLLDASAPYYQSKFQGVFIPRETTSPWWFAFDFSGEEAQSIRWQLSSFPFEEGDSDEIRGLIESGELSLEQSSFSLNIGELISNTIALQKGDLPILVDDSAEFISNDKSPEQSTYYLRVIALDENNQILFAGGRGLPILYGDRLDEDPGQPSIVLKFPLLSPQRAGEASLGGEFPNLLADEAVRFYNTDNSSAWYFKPTDYPENTDTLLLQVTTVEPDANWRSPSGLVYEHKVLAGTEEFDSLALSYTALPVFFNNLGVLPPRLFYVRVIALENGDNLGTVSASYSKTVTVKYSQVESEIEYYPPPVEVAINPGIPAVSLIEYQPIRWEDPEWMYYYEVVRRPTNREYYPLSIAVQNPNDLVEGIHVGDVIKLSPPEEGDSSWLSDAWDAITDFFGSLSDFLASVANWVSEQYDDIKADLAEFIAENLPALPEEWRDDLEQALNYAIDYGLVSVGIPPTLPNFDEMGELGVDYLAATALEQAGIPENELTTELVKGLGEGIANSLNNSANEGNTPNPMLWNFVRQYPQTMYRPAYALIEITNNLDEISLPGTLRGKVFRELTSEDMWVPERQTISASFGGQRYFELYRPIKDVVIPRLLPGQTIQVPIFFEEYTGAAYPWHPHVVSYSEFTVMYSKFGEYNFSLYIDFELPDLETLVDELGYPDDGTIYKFTSQGAGVYFVTEPYNALVH